MMRAGVKGAGCEEEASSSSRLDTKANLASARLLQTCRRGPRASRYLDVVHGARRPARRVGPLAPPGFAFLVHSDQRGAIQPD